MIVRRIDIERFRGLSEFRCELAAGLNVVRGPNESGKTTLQDALLCAFYSKPGAATEKIESTRAWGAERLPRLVLELTLPEGEASLTRDFAEKKTLVAAGERRITAARDAQAWIVERLGCPTEELFEATACIREEEVEIRRLDKNDAVSREILARLQTMLTGAPGGSPGEVMKRLKSGADAIVKKPRPGAEPGWLPLHQGRLDEARRRLQKLRQDLSACDLAEAELGRIRSSLVELERRQAALKTAIGNHVLYAEAARAEAAAAETLARLLKAEKLLAERDRVRAELAGRDPARDLAPLAARLRAMAEERRLREEKLNRLSFDKAQPAAAMAWGTRGWSVAAGVLGACAIAAAAFKFWIPAAGALALALILAGVSAARVRRERRLEEERRRGLEGLITAEDAALRGLDAEVNEIAGVFRKVSVEDCLEEYRRLAELQAEEARLAERIRDLADFESAADLGAEITRLSIRHRSEQERQKELEPYRLPDSARLEEYKREEAEAARELEELRGKQVRAEYRLSSSAVDAGELARLEEEEAEEAERCAHWERRQRVHQKAMEVLRESTETVVARAGEVIEGRLSPLLSRITGGRYDRVRVDAGLRFSLFSAGRGDWIGEDDLSLATREQVHFSARLALCGLIMNGRRPPLLLDDPFAHYDSVRLRAVMSVLKEWSREQQVILFTPSDRYDSFADCVVELRK